MRKDLIVSKSVIINADSNRIWKTLTDPEIIKEYLFGTETLTDWKEGSEIIFQGEYEGKKYRDHGIILKNIDKSKISYSYWSGFSGLEDKPENYSVITYSLNPVNENSVEFTWTQQGFADEDAYKHSESGMQEFIERIKIMAERT